MKTILGLAALRPSGRRPRLITAPPAAASKSRFKENDMTGAGRDDQRTFGNRPHQFGTSNCTNKGLVLSMAPESFIEANYKDLSRDAAAGKGEYVANLARLYGFTTENTGKFVTLLQKNHADIFADNNAKTAFVEINILVKRL